MRLNDQRTDGLTDPLVEMYGRKFICQVSKLQTLSRLTSLLTTAIYLH